MQVLIGPEGLDPARRADVDDDTLAALYAPPVRPWWRASMVATTDGAASGPDGLSGSINDDADGRVFAAMRAAADAVVVGAGTARAEGYGPADVPLVVVSRRGEVPDGLRDAEPGRVVLATGDDAEPTRLRAMLTDRGWTSVMVEGGPSLLGSLLAAGVVDELCLTTVPRLLGGDAGRVVGGEDLDEHLELTQLLEEDGTLLARYAVRRDRERRP